MDQRDYVVSYDKLKGVGFHTVISMEEGIMELVKAAHLIEIHNPHYNA
jgi:hypothetical protein